MANDFTTPGMADVNLGMFQWKSGKNLSQFLKDLSGYSQDKATSVAKGGLIGEGLGALGFLVDPFVGIATSLLGGWGGREYAESQFRDAPSREDYEIMFGQDVLDETQMAFERDEERYDDINQFLDSLGTTTQILMSLYGPKFLGEIFGGVGTGAKSFLTGAKAATAKAGAASVLNPGVTYASASQAGTKALRDYLLTI